MTKTIKICAGFALLYNICVHAPMINVNDKQYSARPTSSIMLKNYTSNHSVTASNLASPEYSKLTLSIVDT